MELNMNNRRRRQQKLESMLKSKHGTQAVVKLYRTTVLGGDKIPEQGLLASDMIARILDAGAANLRP